MPLYTTTIKIVSGTETDYERLSQELKKKSFRPTFEGRNSKDKNVESSMVFATHQSTMLEVSSSVSMAASHTGKKFSFSVIREKPAREL